MGNIHKAVPAGDDMYGFDATRMHEFGPADRGDRALQERAASLGEEQHVGQRRLSVGLREQIIALYDEYRPRLFRYIRSMNLNRDQAEEVIQETFMRLATQLLRQDDIENVQGWIVRVAHNFAVDVHKKNERDAGRVCQSGLTVDDPVDATLNPEQMYLKKEQIRCMEISLQTLNPQQRECFHMRAHGFRYKDIAVALGISEQRAALVVKQVAVRLAAICG